MSDLTAPPDALLRAMMSQKITQIEQEMKSTSDPRKLQEAMERLNQVMKMMSSISRMQHDMTMSIIRNMR